MPRFDEKTAFVTAGATGIGFATAKALAEGGASIMISSLAEDEPKLIEAVEELGDKADYVACDVREDDDVDAAVAATVERFGGLDLAFNCAGTGTYESIREQSTEDFSENLETTLPERGV